MIFILFVAYQNIGGFSVKKNHCHGYDVYIYIYDIVESWVFS